MQDDDLNYLGPIKETSSFQTQIRIFLSSDTLQRAERETRKGGEGWARTKTVWIGIQRRTHLDEDDGDDEYCKRVKFCFFLPCLVDNN